MAAYPWAKLWIRLLSDIRIQRAHRKDGHADALGVWAGLVMLAKKCNQNGLLRDTDGPIMVEDVAAILGLPVTVTRYNLDRFARWHQEDDGWITIAEDGSITLPKFKKLQDCESMERTQRYRKRHGDGHGDGQCDASLSRHGDAQKPRSLEGLEAQRAEKPKEISKATPSHPAKPGKLDDINAVFDHWKATFNHPGSGLDEKRTKFITAALRLYTVDQCKKAIDGCSRTPHNMGQNDNGKPYNGVHIVFKDADQIDRFIRNADDNQSRPAAMDDRTLRTLAEREWQKVARASNHGNQASKEAAAEMLCERTIDGLKQWKQNPVDAFTLIQASTLHEQEAMHGAFVKAWLASDIPFEPED